MIDEILKQLKSVEPQYKTTLPVSKEEVSFHPFKMKDQKTISLISEENDIGIVLSNICLLLKSCSSIESPENLFIADFEYLFLQIRGKSVEENIKLKIDSTPPLTTKIKIDEIKFNPGILEDTISINDQVVLEVEQIKVKDYLDQKELNSDKLLQKTIKAITIGKNRYDLSLLTNDDLEKLIEEITTKDSKKLKDFLNKAPNLFYDIPTDKETIRVEGFLRFFI